MSIIWFLGGLVGLLLFLLVCAFLLFIIAGGFKKEIEKPAQQARIDHESVVMKKVAVVELIAILVQIKQVRELH